MPVGCGAGRWSCLSILRMIFSSKRLRLSDAIPEYPLLGTAKRPLGV